MTTRLRFPCYIQVRMTLKDKELLERKAQEKEMTTSELIRMLIRNLDE